MELSGLTRILLMDYWICLLILAAPALASPERWLQRSAFLDSDRRFHLQWGTGDNKDIVFKLEVRTLGYVALGFSKDGTMVDSDIVVGWVSDGQAYLQDRYSERNQMPELDHQQDWELISGAENATYTTLVFRRKLDTCDSQDFALEYDNTIRVMHAYSFEDPLDEIHIPFHGPNNRGWRSFLLLQPAFTRENEVEYWDVMTSEFSVSREWDYLYWCKIFGSPNLGEKRHVTTVEPLILDGNQGFVHHMVLFECSGADPYEFETHVGRDGYSCFDPNSPDVVRKCDGAYTIWGRGGDALVLPAHIGMPLDAGSTRYYMLEVHYDNVNRVQGSPGRTGLRFHHTDRLRQYDAGLLMVGALNSANMLIPPGVPDFVIAGHGHPDSIADAVPHEGVMMFGAVLHTHNLGKRVKSRHFRNNMELRPLADNKNYDPSYQEHFIYEKEILLLPHDQLTLECAYDSTNMTKTTLGGYSTREEMCTTFIIYYPRFEGFYGSLSYVPKRTTTRLLASQKLNRIPTDPEEYDQTFRDFMSGYDWNMTAIRRFEKKGRFAEHEALCYIGNGENAKVPTTISYPEELTEYVKPLSCPLHRNEKVERHLYSGSIQNKKLEAVNLQQNRHMNIVKKIKIMKDRQSR